MPRTLLLMHSPHHFPSMIMWIFCNATEYHTPISYLLAGSMLRIGTATIRLATCVPREVHYPTIQRIFAFHCNMEVTWILIPTSNFLTFLWTTLLYFILIQSYVLTFPVATPFILRRNKLVVGACLPGTFQIHTFHRPFLVPLTFLLLMRHLIEEAPPPLHPWVILSWCRTF